MAGINSLGGIGTSYERAVALYCIVHFAADRVVLPFSDSYCTQINLQAADPSTKFDDVVLSIEDNREVRIQAKFNIAIKASGEFAECFRKFANEWLESSIIERIKRSWVLTSSLIDGSDLRDTRQLIELAHGSSSYADLIPKLERDPRARRIFDILLNILSPEHYTGTDDQRVQMLKSFHVEELDLMQSHSRGLGALIPLVSAARPLGPDILMGQLRTIAGVGMARGETFTRESLDAYFRDCDFNCLRRGYSPLSEAYVFESFVQRVNLAVSDGLQGHAFERLCELRSDFAKIRADGISRGVQDGERHPINTAASEIFYGWGRLTLAIGSRNLHDEWLDHASHYPPLTAIQAQLLARVAIVADRAQVSEEAQKRIDDPKILQLLDSQRALAAKEFDKVIALGEVIGDVADPSVLVHRFAASLQLFIEQGGSLRPALDAVSELREKYFDSRPVLCCTMALDLVAAVQMWTSPFYRGHEASELPILCEQLSWGMDCAAALLEKGVGAHERLILLHGLMLSHQVYGGHLTPANDKLLHIDDDYLAIASPQLLLSMLPFLEAWGSDAGRALLKQFVIRQADKYAIKEKRIVADVLADKYTPSAIELTDLQKNASRWLSRKPESLASEFAGPYQKVEEILARMREFDISGSLTLLEQLMSEWPGVVSLYMHLVYEIDSIVKLSREDEGREQPFSPLDLIRETVLQHLFCSTGSERILTRLINHFWHRGNAAGLASIAKECSGRHSQIAEALSFHAAGELDKALSALRSINKDGRLVGSMAYLYDELRYVQGSYEELISELENRPLSAETDTALFYHPAMSLARCEHKDQARSLVRELMHRRPDEHDAYRLAISVYQQLGDIQLMIETARNNPQVFDPNTVFQNIPVEEFVARQTTWRRDNEVMSDAVERSALPIVSLREDPLKAWLCNTAAPSGLAARRINGAISHVDANKVADTLVLDYASLITIAKLNIFPQLEGVVKLQIPSAVRFYLNGWAEKCKREVTEGKQWFGHALPKLTNYRRWKNPTAHPDYKLIRQDTRSVDEDETAVASALSAISVCEEPSEGRLCAYGLARVLLAHRKISESQAQRVTEVYKLVPYSMVEPPADAGLPKRILVSYTSALLLEEAGILDLVADLFEEFFWSPIGYFEHGFLYGHSSVNLELAELHKQIAKIIEQCEIILSDYAPANSQVALEQHVHELGKLSLKGPLVVWTDDLTMARLLSAEHPGSMTCSIFEILVMLRQKGRLTVQQERSYILDAHLLGIRGTDSTQLLSGATDTQLRTSALRLGNLLREQASNSIEEQRHHLGLVHSNISVAFLAWRDANVPDLGKRLREVAQWIAEGANASLLVKTIYGDSRLRTELGLHATYLDLALQNVLPRQQRRVLDPRRDAMVTSDGKPLVLRPDQAYLGPSFFS